MLKHELQRGVPVDDYAGAGAALPRPGSSGGLALITSGSGVAACAPLGGSTFGAGGGG